MERVTVVTPIDVVKKVRRGGREYAYVRRQIVLDLSSRPLRELMRYTMFDVYISRTEDGKPTIILVPHDNSS